jgi:hypothetical protein
MIKPSQSTAHPTLSSIVTIAFPHLRKNSSSITEISGTPSRSINAGALAAAANGFYSISTGPCSSGADALPCDGADGSPLVLAPLPDETPVVQVVPVVTDSKSYKPKTTEKKAAAAMAAKGRSPKIKAKTADL